MGSPLERLWKDKMTVYQWVPSTVNNVTKSTENIVAVGVKCHYSIKSLTVIGEGGAPALTSVQKIFCGLDAKIKEGDKVIVTLKNGNTVSLTAGEAIPYSNHMEFIVKRSDKA